MRRQLPWFWGLFGMILVAGFMAMINGIFTESFLLDESLFARNIAAFPGGFFLQSAPSAPLFYLLTWLFVQVFGKSEWVYRLLPLLAAMGGVAVIIRLLLTRFSRTVTLVITFLMMTCYWLSHYAGNAHSYTMDFFTTAVMMAVTLHYMEKKDSRSRALWIVTACLSVILSFTAFFVAAAYGAYLMIESLFLKDKKIFLFRLTTVVPVAIFMLVLLKFLYLPHTSERTDMGYWGGFFPASWLPWVVAKWFFNSTIDVLGYYFWNNSHGLVGLFLMLIGSAAFIQSGRQRLAWLGWAPIMMSVVVAILHKWPWGPVRTTVFVLPLFLFLMASGLESIWNTARHRWTKALIIVGFLALLVPNAWVLKWAVKKIPDGNEAIRTLAATLESRIQEEDRFLVHYAAKTQFDFYFPTYMDRAVYQEWEERDRADLQIRFFQKHLEDMDGRVWLIFTGSWKNEESEMVQAAQAWGEIIEKINPPGCSAYLWVGADSLQSGH